MRRAGEMEQEGSWLYKELEDRLKFETLLADLSSRFINLPPGEVDREIENGQRRVCEYLDLDLATLWQWPAEGPASLAMTHLYRPLGGPPVPEAMDARSYFPWTLAQIKAGRIISLASVEDVPPEGARDRETACHFGAKSTLTFPLSAGGGSVFGALTFASMREKRDWPDALVKRLQLVAQVFANALARKRGDEALRESQEVGRATFDQAAVGMAHVGTGGRWLQVNDRLCAIVGYSRQEMLQMTFQDITYPDDLEADLDRMHQVLSGEITTYSREKRYIRKDRALVWINLTVSLVRSATGEPRHFIAVVEDITERKRTEKALRESEERLRRILEANSEGFWDWNIQTGEAYFSPHYSGMLGYTPEEFATSYKSWKTLVHPDDFERVNQAHMDHFNKHQDFCVELRMRKKSGDWCWILSRGTVVERDAEGNAIRMVGTHLEITERKRSEEALRASENKYRSLVEMTGTGYLILDMRGRVLDANQEYLRMSGHSELREIVGRSVIEWTADQEKHRNAAAVAQCIQDGFIRSFVTEYANGGGKPTFVEVNATVEGEGAAARIVSLCRDITQRKQAESETQRLRQELSHVARVNMMGELTASLAHELAQPLTAIRTNTQTAQLLLASDRYDKAEFAEILSDIVADDTRASEIIRRMRSLLKRGDFDAQLLDLNDLIREVEAIVRPDARLKDVNVVTKLTPDLPPVLGDRIQLQQVVMNLMVNALEAVAGRGDPIRRVEVLTSEEEPGEIRAAVRDTGLGIPQDQFERIFDPFVTTKKEGMGMGLAICRTITTAHGGRLWAQNEPEGGATFYLALPSAGGNA